MPSKSHQSPSIGLVSLSIRNFRGIEKLDFDFLGPDGLPNRLAVLAGPNGCGKTSVLEAARLVSPTSSSMLDLVAKRAIRRGAIRRGAEDFSIEGVFKTVTGTQFELIVQVSSSGRKVSRPDLVPCSYFPSDRSSGFVGGIDVNMDQTRQFHLKPDRNRLRSLKQQLVNASAVERYSQSWQSNPGVYSQWTNSIAQAWNEFDPSQNASFEVGLTNQNDSAKGSFDLYYLRPGHSRIEVDLLSSGQLELFLFIAELAFNKEREGIVLIDEPELHLDPQWHRPLIRSLMRLQPRVQFIVTTHSPEIYDSAYSYERHFLVPEDDPRAQIWDEKRPAIQGA